MSTTRIRGRWVIYRHRKFTRVDNEAALAELAAILKRPRTPEQERRRGVSRRVMPFIRDFYLDDLPDERPNPFYVTSAR